jgi:hypothetical protein
MSRSLLAAVALLAIFATPGCSDSNTPTGPTPAPVPIVTDSFSGTLTVNGAITHPFLVSTPSTVTATLVAVSPDSTIPIGLSIGTWNNTTESCQTVISNDLALQGRVLIGTAQTSGAFCVRVYDVGRLTLPTTYDIQVSHQ